MRVISDYLQGQNHEKKDYGIVGDQDINSSPNGCGMIELSSKAKETGREDVKN